MIVLFVGLSLYWGKISNRKGFINSVSVTVTPATSPTPPTTTVDAEPSRAQLVIIIRESWTIPTGV